LKPPILIRGNDAQNYEKYLGDFGVKENLVQSMLKELKITMNEQAIDAARVDGLLSAHRDLGKKHLPAARWRTVVCRRSCALPA